MLRWIAGFGVCAMAAALPAHALDLPVIHPESDPVTGPSYLGDRLELRLRDGVASATRTGSAARPARLDRLGVLGVDRLAQGLGGAWFEPEFRGETPPVPGSGATDFTAFYIVHLEPGVNLEVALARFRALGEVASADPIAILPVSAVPNDSLWSQSTWFFQPSRHDIHVTEAWDVTTGDTSIVIGILDTGVLAHHPDLGGRTPGGTGQMWINRVEANGVAGVDDDANGFIDDVRGWDFVDLPSSTGIPACEDWQTPDNDPSDYAGHGTAVAGLAGALTNNQIGVTGTAWKVRLMPLRIGWAADSAPLGFVDMSYVAQAIRYATRNGAHVLNCSFATLDLSGLYAAADEAVRAGVTIVAAAGNGGQQHELALREDVVAVAATTETDELWFSSNTGDYVDLAAPGHDVVSTFTAAPGGDCIVRPAYSSLLSGTSMSAPLVTGAVALLQARRRAQSLPLFSPYDVLLRLRETTDDISALNPGWSGYGTGRLNVARLLTDPPGSHAFRIGGRTVGPAVVLPTLTGIDQIFTVTTHDPGPPLSGLAAADLAPGAGIGLFASLAGGRVMGVDVFGTPLPGWPVATGNPSIVLSMPALGDLDGDGAIEVVCGGDDGNVWAWRRNGSPVTGFPVDVAAPTGAVALSDLDGLPGVEIVAINATGDAFVIRSDGSSPAGWPLRLETPVSAPVIGHLGTGSVPTIIAGAGPRLVALAPDGSQRFAVALTAPIGGTANQDPALGDLDGDGSDEIVVAVRGTSRLAVFDSAGALFRRWPHPLPDSATGPPVIGQLRGGTNAPEIAVFAGDLVAYSDSAVALPAFPKPGHAGEQPTLVDLDSDGSTDVVAGTGPDSVYYIYSAGPGSAAGTASPWPTPRGNFARTGSRLYAPSLTVPDVVAPAAVSDLAADSIGTDAVRLTWTAPGDDGATGTATAYDLRRSTQRIEAANFDFAIRILAPSPSAAGTREHITTDFLAGGTTYFFALRTTDEAGNASAISNLLSVTPGDGRPGKILDLAVVSTADTTVTLRWSATGDDGPLGRPERYLIYVSTGPPIDPFKEGPIMRSKVASAAPGFPETYECGGLEPDRLYYFLVFAEDVASAKSDVSNVVTARTQPSGPFGGRPGAAILSRRQPSPVPVELFWQGVAGTPANQSIRIFDIGGRQLRKLALGAETAGLAKWDGRDEHGSLVPAGMYYARLISGSVHVQTRVVLLP